jgi:hypothetical protein
MALINDTRSKRRLPAKSAGTFALSVILVLGAMAGSANAADRRGDDRRGGDRHSEDTHRAAGHREARGHRVWSGGYYAAPPVVYGNPYAEPVYPYGEPGYYYPPPVVYGPSAGVGINLPGVSLGIGVR